MYDAIKAHKGKFYVQVNTSTGWLWIRAYKSDLLESFSSDGYDVMHTSNLKFRIVDGGMYIGKDA